MNNQNSNQNSNDNDPRGVWNDVERFVDSTEEADRQGIDLWLVVFGCMAESHVWHEANQGNITIQDYIYESVREAILQGARINQSWAYQELCRQLEVAC